MPFICETLGLTYTELQEQPFTWTMRMLVIKEQRAKIDKLESEKNKAKSKK